MKRRGFLGALLGAAVLDPEKLLWVPGKKVISVPPQSAELRRDIRWIMVANPGHDSDWLRQIYLMQAETIEAARRAPWVGIDITWE